MTDFHQRLRSLAPPLLKDIRRGIEKEGLRVRQDGMLSSEPHPAALGSALTHPNITTDFSESQLELITGVHTDIDACLLELTELHQVVQRQLGDELLLCTSMPCRLPADDEIPIATFGGSNIGRLKTLYRHGLARRYGRRMQTISGIHYNFSLPEAAWPLLKEAEGRGGPIGLFKDERYFALLRNFRRRSWLLLLLLGASPAVCKSFVQGREHRLTAWDSGTLYAPEATSLRMGRLGYQSDAQASLAVSFNDLSGYAGALNRALTQPYPAYEAIGLRAGDEYLQLATSLLQIENEFYGTIRPKRSIRRGERALCALGQRGVEYVEVRCLDIDPFTAIGIDADAIRLVDLFLLHCVLSDSPPDTPQEIEAMRCNQQRVAESGRGPDTRLIRGDAETTPADWGGEVLAQCEALAEALDEAHGGKRYRDVLSGALRALRSPSSLPSARVLKETEQTFARSFPAFALAQSRRHWEALSALPLPAEVEARHAALAARSLDDQRAIEAADDVDFETFRQRYLDQDLLSGPHFRRSD